MMHLTSRKLCGAMVLAVVGMVSASAFAEGDGPPQPWSKWKVHDMARPMAPVVTPGTPSTPEQPGKAPSDAIILFDGTNLDQWVALDGKAPGFKLEDGVMVANKAYIRTKQEFGDVQMHVEWMEPSAKGDSQGRGNSGIFFMGEFETQVLDNFKNPTYADGACGSIYGQYPPQVNACLPPGTWQTYDLVFHRPRYEGNTLKEPAYITVIQNGVLVQDHHRIEGPTAHMHVASYPSKAMPEKGSIHLQFHGNPVKYRNIWVRPLEALEHQQETGDVASSAAAVK
jgi:hypothetical protein